VLESLPVRRHACTVADRLLAQYEVRPKFAHAVAIGSNRSFDTYVMCSLHVTCMLPVPAYWPTLSQSEVSRASRIVISKTMCTSTAGAPLLYAFSLLFFSPTAMTAMTQYISAKGSFFQSRTRSS
jgi:hypothetical protein